MHRIVIVGGGFGGVTAALQLAKARLPHTHVTLISDKPWLEYYGVLYRLIRGESPDEACLPLRIILPRSVDVIIDAISDVDPRRKTVKGTKKTYPYDTLILAPGSVPSYFGIRGMDRYAMTMKSAADAVAIRRRVMDQMTVLAKTKDAAKRRQLGRFVVIGGGPTGIEVAGEVLPLAQKMAKKHGIPLSLIRVDLLEAADRLLSIAHPAASEKIQSRLTKLGVNVRLQCAVASAQPSSVLLKDGERIDAATIIWTAGVKAHPLLETIEDITIDKRRRAVVDALLRIPKHPDIFILGDCAATPYSGMAQTAVEDGVFVVRVIRSALRSTQSPVYTPIVPAYAIPAGPAWSAVKFGPLRVYGIPGAVMRRAADIHVYMLILPWYRIPAAFFGRSMKRTP